MGRATQAPGLAMWRASPVVRLGQGSLAPGVLAWGSGPSSRWGKGKPALAPRDAFFNPTQRQVSSGGRCPRVGARARLPPRAIPPKLEATIFS